MSYIKSIKDDNKGFTLIELILTVVILALVTAPFLSSFATAGKTNVKAKRRQQANNIGDYLAEKFKATDTKQIDASFVTGVTNPATGELVYDIPNDKLPSEYGTKYTAKVTLNPDPAAVNGNVTPVPVSLDATNSAIFMADFYKNDDVAASKGPVTFRVCEINFEYNPLTGGSNPYIITLDINYYNGTTANKVYTAPKVQLAYSSVPDLYLFYTPFSLSAASDSDLLIINSNLIQSYNIYLTKQTATAHQIIPANVRFNYKTVSGSCSQSLLQLDNSDKLKGDYYNIYTNMATTNNLVQSKSVETLYKMKIEVFYDGKKVLTYDSSKNDNK